MSEARSESLEATVETLASRLSGLNELLLCLEFDGTLAVSGDDPDETTVRPEMRAAMAELHSHRSVTVAVTSGRSLDDVRARVDLPGVTYAGNHGLELRTEGVRNVHPVAETYRPDVDHVCAELRDAFAGEASVAVEHRGQTLAVHHRRVPDSRVPAVWKAVARAVGEFASGTLTVRGGDGEVEVRPAVAWDRGSVVSSLLDERASCLPVFVGDARTDEAGFRAVEREGVGVRVGDAEERATAATEFVRDADEATALLEWLCRTGVERLDGPGATTRRGLAAGATDDRYTKSD
jgi:trehalose 6-phosphate phosphatase